jgi:hypothetical protein
VVCGGRLSCLTARRSACGGGDSPGSAAGAGWPVWSHDRPGGKRERRPASSGKAGTSRPSSSIVLLCPRATRATRTGFSMTHRRRLCRSGPGPSRRSVLLSGSLHRRVRCSPSTRSSERDSRRLHARCMRRRLPPRGCSPLAGIDLPEVPARCCQAQQNDRLVTTRPRTAGPALIRTSTPPGRRGTDAGAGWPPMGTGTFSQCRRPYCRRAPRPARRRCPRWCGCRRQRG